MALVVIITTIIVLILGYRGYARRIDRETVQSDQNRPTPALRFSDGDEFLPTSRAQLFLYQFKSISLDPILGSIIAVQFGWLPALLWLLCGVIFIGWVQDYAMTLASLRNGGMNLAELAGKWINPHARNLLLSYFYIYLLIVLSGMCVLLAPVMARDTVPFGFLIMILSGLLMGHMLVRWRINVIATTVLTVSIALAGVYVGGLSWATTIVDFLNHLGGYQASIFIHRPLGYNGMTWSEILWMAVILGFCYLGAILPTWRFTRPVNQLAAWLVMVTMLGATAGIVVATFTGTVKTSFELPAVVAVTLPNLGSVWPILFVTIWGGAASGWKVLVSTYGTSRQITKERDILPVTVGAAYFETFLVVLVIIFAVTSGVTGGGYDPLHNYQIRVGPASVFANGLIRFLGVLGVPAEGGLNLAALCLVAISLTAMQLGLRYARLVGTALFGEHIPLFYNKHFSALAVIFLTLTWVISGFWQWSWMLFGAANLLLVGIALLLISVWLAELHKSYRWTFWPALFTYATGLGALLYTGVYQALFKNILQGTNQNNGVAIGNFITTILSIYILYVTVNLLINGINRLRQNHLRK